MARRVLGLDLGSHSVKAVELRQALGRDLEVVQLRRFELDDPAPALATELRQLVSAHDLPLQHVVVSVAGDRLSTRCLSFPFKERRKVAAAVPFEVEEQVPFDLKDYLVDWDLAGESAAGVDVAACIVPIHEVEILLETLGDAGVVPRVIEAEGLVLSNLATLLELPGTRVLADVGHRKTTLALCRDGRVLASRTVPIAGKALTRAIAEERGLGELEAERVKQQEAVIGNPRATRAVAVLDRLAREIARTLASFEPLLTAGGVERAHLLGGSAKLAGLDAYLSERTGVAWERLPMPRGPLGAAFVAQGDTLLFAPAMALALRGTTLTATRVNLRQGRFAERIDLRGILRELRPTALLAGGALLSAGLYAGSDIWMSSRTAGAHEAASRAIASEALRGADPGADALAGMQRALRDAERRAETLGVYRGNLSALDLLTEISAHVPDDLDVVFEELAIERDAVQIRGHSPDFKAVDRLTSELKKFAAFSEVVVGSSDSDARRGGVNFDLRIRVASPGGAS
jgi:general secretion pathway protein L